MRLRARLSSVHVSFSAYAIEIRTILLFARDAEYGRQKNAIFGVFRPRIGVTCRHSRGSVRTPNTRLLADIKDVSARGRDNNRRIE